MSRFGKIFEAASGHEPPAKRSVKRRGPGRPPKAQETEPPRRPGRPNGKRSDPEFTQTTAYIREATYLDIQDELRAEKRRVKRDARDYSDLVEELLAKWLKARKRKGEDPDAD